VHCGTAAFVAAVVEPGAAVLDRCCAGSTAWIAQDLSTGPGSAGPVRPANEHDACGVGFVAHIKGQKAHAIVEQGLKILENLDHRGAVGADKLMGDGAGILIQIPDEFYRAEMAGPGHRRCRRPASTAWA
jgi:hypothetical protein